MNLHLFLDVVAWVFGAAFGLAVVSTIVMILTIEITYNRGRLLFCGIIATICWAWIIAG